MNHKCDILILGATGMLGSTMLRYFDSRNEFIVHGTIRAEKSPNNLLELDDILIKKVDVEDISDLSKIFIKYHPKYVINCVGIVKQLDTSCDSIKSIQINALLPHQLNNLCKKINARLVHISTDCVYDGKLGNYCELDPPNAVDLYGRTKFLGEVIDPTSITIRTSIIGHEIGKSHSLLEWFLSQKSEVNGFRNAIFSGLPTIELSRVIHDFVIPNNKLSGLYHVSANPINKFDLLSLVAEEYQKNITIIPDDTLVIDRSLNSSKFTKDTGFKTNSWKNMIYEMHKFG
ncbi:SDR family oxidoreductase [Gammaproteobacteria bacterium]|jgi:dTDP-4-dehydrorhamnose reductase|nr:SDR family oxidoreductase [Gammaproteobacteria bacterium]